MCFSNRKRCGFKYRFMVYIEFVGKYSNKSDYRNFYKKQIIFVFTGALVENIDRKIQRSRLDSKHHHNRTFAERKHNTNRKLEFFPNPTGIILRSNRRIIMPNGVILQSYWIVFLILVLGQGKNRGLSIVT